jgi:hypothetical protein
VSLPIPSLPSSEGAYRLVAGSFGVTLPTTVNSTDDAVGVTSYAQEIPGLDGLFSYRNPTFVSRSLSLDGVVMDENVVRALKRVLAVKKVTVERDERSVDAEVVSFSITERVYGSVWGVSVQLNCLKPWWEADTLSILNNTSYGSPHVITIVNSGDVTVYPVFTVTGGSGGLASIAFEVDGRVVLWSGNLSEGSVLRIDCGSRIATIDLDNALGDMDEDFLVDPLRFAVGTSLVGVTFIGTYDSYNVSWRELFL